MLGFVWTKLQIGDGKEKIHIDRQTEFYVCLNVNVSFCILIITGNLRHPVITAGAAVKTLGM